MKQRVTKSVFETSTRSLNFRRCDPLLCMESLLPKRMLVMLRATLSMPLWMEVTSMHKPLLGLSLALLALGFGGCSSTSDTASVGTPVASARAAKAAPATEVAGLCTADGRWLSATTGPVEIGGGKPLADETNCQFQQFSWQWFLVMMQPGATGERAFEGLPSWLGPNVTDQCGLKAQTGRAAFAKNLFMRDQKDPLASDASAFLPTETGQATGGLLYDQATNIVLYNVRYSPKACQPTPTGYQPNTVEIKSAWRVVTSVTGFDPSSYYTFQADIAGFQGTQTLALVGFHVVVNTAKHPEFVWGTFEHKSNAPDCTEPAAAPATGWSFTSAAAAQCLATIGPAGCGQYNFNVEVSGSSGDPVSITGTPDEVCRAFPDGTDPASTTGGNNNDTNRFNIDQLNEQLVGTDGLLTKLPAENPLAVLKNYELVGSLWTLNGVASGGTDVLRGSLELANLTMETNFQDAGNNCFTCHNFAPDTTADPDLALKVSHLYSSLQPQPAATASPPAGK